MHNHLICLHVRVCMWLNERCNHLIYYYYDNKSIRNIFYITYIEKRIEIQFMPSFLFSSEVFFF